ncbi:PREDICTED: uncharacterized protein LOC18590458 isoform X2 [Theobroma cacao]|uniref:Uncharacterized protein LOC18590458 isoform X2 n=1 Tax=Theobroma cacao TaxID=3641 RepID=A0AB32WWJ9_THECC|nr:PREDICTED: uncharacterized protein LOC18590458 isoform X2 [Theobroma cacao]
MSLPSQESQSELNQCPNLAAMVHNVEPTPLAISPDDLTQRSLNSQFHPDVEVETGSVAQNGDLSLILTSKTDMPRPGGGNANELPQQFDSSDQPLNSLADNLTADQLVNSHGNVETGVRCSEPNQSHLDHEERPSDQASNGRKQRGRKPRVIPVEKSKNQLDQAGTSAKAGNGQKRRSRKPIIRTEEQENERKKIKKEIDRRYRRGKKNELTELRKLEQDLDRVMTIASGFGRIDQMVSQINRMSCELQKVQQEEVGNGMFLQEIIDSADRVPPIRANEVRVYAWSDKCKGHHGTQSSDLDRVNGTHSWLLSEVSNDEINLRLPAAVRGANAMHDMQYSDASVTKFMAKLDDDKAMSNVDLSSFKDLDGECENVGNYNIPLCLVSTAQDIIKAKDDITKQSRFGQCV